MFIWSI